MLLFNYLPVLDRLYGKIWLDNTSEELNLELSLLHRFLCRWGWIKFYSIVVSLRRPAIIIFGQGRVADRGENIWVLQNFWIKLGKPRFFNLCSIENPWKNLRSFVLLRTPSHIWRKLVTRLDLYSIVMFILPLSRCLPRQCGWFWRL